jgi:ligand-binding sensor domain-containing protein
MKNLGFSIVTMMLIGLLSVTACQINSSETHTPIPVKDIAIVWAGESPDDVVPTPGGGTYRGNVHQEGEENPWPPIDSTDIVLGGGTDALNVSYRDHIETVAGESRNNIIRIRKEGGFFDSELALYSTDVPAGLELADGGRGVGLPGTLGAILVIEISPEVALGEYNFEIGLEINGKDYGTIPCTIDVISNEVRSQEASSMNEPSSGNESVLKSFITGDTVLGLVASKNEVWAATSGGVIWWDLQNESRSKYTTQNGLGSNAVRVIIRDSQGNIWVTCYVSGVSRFDGNQWDSFTVKNGLCSDQVITLASDEKGGVWVSAYWGVSYFDGQEWASYSNVDPEAWVVGGENPMKDCRNLIHVDAELSAVDVIFVDSSGDVWFSDRGDGVTRFDGRDWRMFTIEDGLAKGGVNAIFEDKDGILWFGSNLGGITCFDGKDFTAFDINEYQSIVPRPAIMDIIQDSLGDIWAAAHGGGVARFDGNSWQVFRSEDSLPSDNAQHLFLDHNGYPGVITMEGVGLFDGSTWRVMTLADGLPEGRVRTVTSDENGNLWFGAEGGISYYIK